MKNLSGPARALSVAALVAGLAVGATRVSGSVELAEADERTGLAESSTVLVDEAGLVCPGPQRVGAAGLRAVTGTVIVAASAAPAAALSIPSGAGSVSVETGRTNGAPAKGAERGRVISAPATAPEPVFVTGTAGLAPGLAATQIWQRAGDDDRGLVVTPCSLPSSDVWLVGGGDGASRSERIIVGNPGANAVTVAFEVFGANGPVATAEGRRVSIPPRSRTAVSLDAIAPDTVSPAVHVIATGGVVSAVLDDAWIEGATGRGADDATRAAAPATEQVVAGLDVDGVSWVRIVNPSDAEALVQVRVLTPKGPDQPAALRAVRVPAGSAKDVPLGLAPGPAGLRLTSDQPVVAAAYLERRAASGADRMSDFGWAPATPALRAVAGVQLPGLTQPGTKKSLLLAAASGGGAVVVHALTGATERAVPVTLAADSAATVDLAAADQVWVSVDNGDVRAAVTVSGSTAGVPWFSVAALASAPVTALSIPVRQISN